MSQPGMCSAAKRLRAYSLLAVMLTMVAGFAPTRAGAGSVPSAHTARTVTLQETGHLTLAYNNSGSTIAERGRAVGTYDCAITVSLEVSIDRVTAKFTVRPTGGTISGKGTARYAVEHEYGYFGGTIAITHGTGHYAHAAGKEIGISGKINRETFVLTVHVHGTMHV